MSPSKIP